RVGENDPFRVDVRVLCATNRDLREMIEVDQFREDLFFRINTFEIHLPPLRDRAADIPVLAEHLLKRYARRSGAPAHLSAEAVEALVALDWPGNIRELANAIERATILSGGGTIDPQHLPTPPTSRRATATAVPSLGGSAIAGPHFQIPDGNPTLRDV